MKIRITRPVVITGSGGTRTLVPGLTVEVDEPTSRHLLNQQAGIPAEPDAAAAAAETHTTQRPRKSTHAQT